MEHSRPAVAVSNAFARRFATRAAATNSSNTTALSFADFMDVALYDPEVGYYRQDRARIGRTAGTDFYTATNMGGVFGPLVAAAATNLLGAERAAACEFVEVGAEPGRCVVDGVLHGFRGVRTVRVGAPLELRGDVVVFSNELFDAQPFHRVVFRGGGWREAGVQMQSDGTLHWTELPAMSSAVAEAAVALPSITLEGYVLDLPLAAMQLAATIARQPWRGLFLAFDYGRTWQQLITEFPAGTGRAYTAHQLTGELLDRPGAQDLTCHVCWDWLEAALVAAGCESVTRESQEGFFVRRATAAVQQIVMDDPDPLSLQRTRLKHLLHPALMGQRFEALWALRV